MLNMLIYRKFEFEFKKTDMGKLASFARKQKN